ncbi:uncharacterized protein FOMMEDRAFT_166479 [Fomitiporia mediterranea MF3/22]|uniref:uncharacterized protein n=1 Tax=Fomitiporia mediterranea (strain MF3/22) TaxID=694068 RepID=UPI0004407C4D|nr:uncharacterized protein FOMMEDRAFT_166479 [Fomitiporia mediterranea MF3/22]EJD06235.1 hypothetical protein FOMMEDRAFT_166479 [Fomitiporia mediterranea MF3/22]
MVSIPESIGSEPSPPQNQNESNRSPNVVRTQPLTARQERKLVEYIEDLFLEVMRNYKKRSHPSSTLPTLQSYLHATHPLLSLILQIPPSKQQQSALRTALLLRFTSECLCAIPNYPPPTLSPISSSSSDQSGVQTLRQLLTWLDELDKGWYTVLCAQAWDATAQEGVDVELDVDGSSSPTNTQNSDLNSAGLQSETQMEDYSPTSLGPRDSVSQTDRTRLRSLLLAGIAALEEWLDNTQPPSTAIATNDHIFDEADSNRPDLEETLEHLGLQQSFDDLFSRTLSAMGELGGEVLSVGEELEME